MDFQGVSWILFFVYVASEQEDQNQSHSLIEGKMTTQSVTWSATAFKRLFFSEVISGNGWCSFFYLRRVFEYDAQNNEILSLQSKIEITFWWLNAKWKISNLATWNLNPCNFFPFWSWKKSCVTQITDFKSNVRRRKKLFECWSNTTLLYDLWSWKEIYFHQPQSVPRKGLFSLLLPVMGLTFPSMAVSCHLKLS